LIDPAGRFAHGFEADTPPDRMAAEVRELMHHATQASAFINQSVK